MKKFTIFLSCGQENRQEKEDGMSIKSYFESNDEFKTKVDIKFAEEIYSPTGLTDVIYKNIKESHAFVGIFHRREKIGKEDGKIKYRSSLFVNQELAIFSYVNHNGINEFWRIYAQNDIKVEGVDKYLMNRTIPFTSSDEIISDLEEVIREWLLVWKPSNSRIHFEPPILSIGNRHTGKLMGIHMDFQIDNLISEPINNFTIGIIAPKHIEIERVIGSKIEMQIRGQFSNYFESKREVVHYIITDELRGNFAVFKKYQILWHKDPPDKEFQIGFYVKGDNLDLTSYYLRIYDLDFVNNIWKSDFGLCKDVCIIY